jgi:Ras-related protein Rab-14
MLTERTFTPDSSQTVGVEFGTRIVSVDGTKIKLQIWDTAGQERFRAVTRSYYRGAAGALLVYDITRRETFNRLDSWLQDLRNLTSPTTVIVLLGNKCDLTSKREVAYEEAARYAEENGLVFVETSAKTGERVEDAFVRLATLVHQHVVDGSTVLGADSGVLRPSVVSPAEMAEAGNACSC